MTNARRLQFNDLGGWTLKSEFLDLTSITHGTELGDHLPLVSGSFSIEVQHSCIQHSLKNRRIITPPPTLPLFDPAQTWPTKRLEFMVLQAASAESVSTISRCCNELSLNNIVTRALVDEGFEVVPFSRHITVSRTKFLNCTTILSQVRPLQAYLHNDWVHWLVLMLLWQQLVC